MKKLYNGIYVCILALMLLCVISCDDDDCDRTCLVTLVCNINSGVEGDELYYEVQAGEMLPVPELVKEGYEFAGWYTDQATANNHTASATIKFEPYDLDNIPIYLDVVLYARWIK